MKDGELSSLYRLLKPHALPRLPSLGLVFLTGAITAGLQALVLGLFQPIWDLVLFPAEGAKEVGSREAVFVRPFARLGAWTADVLGLSDARLGVLVSLVVIALLMGVVAGAAQYACTWLSRWIGFQMIVDLRVRLARHLMGLSVRYHGERRFGDLLSRVSSDVTTTLHAVNEVFKGLLQEPLFALTTLAVAFVAAPLPTLAIIVILPLLVMPVSRLSKKVRRGSKKSLTTLGASVQVLTQIFSGIRTVKSFGGEERELARYRDVNQRYLRSSMRMVRAISLTHGWTAFYSIAGVAILVAALGWLTIRFEIFEHGGQMTVFFLAIARLNNHVKNLTRAQTRLQESVGASARILELLDEPADVVEAPSPRRVDGIRAGLRFEGVTFTYLDSSEPALRGIDLEVRAGETLALVGHSGAGKSTLVDLVARFIDPTVGRLTVDGVDLRELALADWTAKYAMVGQVPFLFHASIAENIGYGKLGASQAEIEAAARAADIHDFIASLPEGYETNVADMGSRLSGGQRQRITIARALLKGAPLLLLDEATSALDSRSEAEVQRALERLMADRTVIVIAHRLSTIRDADRIAVLDNGRLVELGTHAELIARGGPYAGLHALQVGGARGGVPAGT